MFFPSLLFQPLYGTESQRLCPTETAVEANPVGLVNLFNAESSPKRYCTNGEDRDPRRWGKTKTACRCTVTTRVTPCFKMGSDESHFIASLTKSQYSVHKPQVLKKEESRSGIEPRLGLNARPVRLSRGHSRQRAQFRN